VFIAIIKEPSIVLSQVRKLGYSARALQDHMRLTGHDTSAKRLKRQIS